MKGRHKTINNLKRRIRETFNSYHNIQPIGVVRCADCVINYAVCFCFLQVLLSAEVKKSPCVSQRQFNPPACVKDPVLAMAQTEAKTTCTRRRRQFLPHGQNRQQQLQQKRQQQHC